ncbi:hypothetical protein HY837_06205 [archaeon]|nr:hypothetical protein [archaeon]
MIPRRADGTPLEDYGLVDICNNHDFILIDTCAATDTECIFFNGKQRSDMGRLGIKYSLPLEIKIEYNSLIGLLMVNHDLYVTIPVLEEIEDYRKNQKGALLKSIDNILKLAETFERIISLEKTEEFKRYTKDPFFNRLAEENGLSEVDFNLLAQFFASTNNIDGKKALITNDRGILRTYKRFSYRLPGEHMAFTCLFSKKYEPQFAKK